VSGVADAEQAGTLPLAQAVDLHREELDRVPVRQLADPVAEERHHGGNGVAERRQAPTTQLVVPTLGDDEGALPVVTAVEHHQDVARAQVAEGPPRW